MALKKTIETLSGATAEYHRIVNIDVAAKRALKISVAVFKDAAARAANKAPMHREEIVLTGGDFDLMVALHLGGGSLYNELATACYSYLKALPKYSGAVDV